MQEILEQHATLYTLGMLDEAETSAFKARLSVDQELARLVMELNEAQAVTIVADARIVNRRPDDRIRERIMNRVLDIIQQPMPQAVIYALKEAHFPAPAPHEAVVLSDWDGLVRWVNPVYTKLTGRRLGELRGRKAGPLLRGVRSEPGVIEAFHHAIQKRLPVVQQIVNYHKDGRPYLVEVDLRPVASGFIAVERELAAA